MKLLRLKIGNLPKGQYFRSLHAGFEIEFRKLDLENLQNLYVFDPFCLVGLNGSGKSNVLEALTAIFFHLECCAARYKPASFWEFFHPEVCNPDAFELEYLIGPPGVSDFDLTSFMKIRVMKQAGKRPEMFKQIYPFSEKEEKVDDPDEEEYVNEFEQSKWKHWLPDIIAGYSSGENETLSLIFRKSCFINFDKYREDFFAKNAFTEPENSLIYIDSGMSQAVLLVCLLYAGEETLKPLKEELGIGDISSFRLHFNLHRLFGYLGEEAPILEHIKKQIDDLKCCATAWYEEKSENEVPSLTLDFFVNEETKKAFRHYFQDFMGLFRLFQVLYELNSHFVPEEIKKDVYRSRGFYTDGKIPVGSPEQNVFYFLDFLIWKKMEDEKQPKELLLREFSDGEHQFLHTMGICLLLKKRRSLLLLDEPETHFNPDWRVKFIKFLNDSIKAGGGNNLLKDILLTSHSPFIISDCTPERVICFGRNKVTRRVEVHHANDLELKTYGSSITYILKNFFQTNLVSSKSLSELKEVIENGSLDQLTEAVEEFGVSSEKQFLFRRIYEKMHEDYDHSLE